MTLLISVPPEGHGGNLVSAYTDYVETFRGYAEVFVLFAAVVGILAFTVRAIRG